MYTGECVYTGGCVEVVCTHWAVFCKGLGHSPTLVPMGPGSSLPQIHTGDCQVGFPLMWAGRSCNLPSSLSCACREERCVRGPQPRSPLAAASLWPHGQQVCGACDHSVSSIGDMVDEQLLFLPRLPPAGVPGGRQQAMPRCHRAHSAPTREQMLEGTLDLERSTSVHLPAPLCGLRQVLDPFPPHPQEGPWQEGIREGGRGPWQQWPHPRTEGEVCRTPSRRC